MAAFKALFKQNESSKSHLNRHKCKLRAPVCTSSLGPIILWFLDDTEKTNNSRISGVCFCQRLHPLHLKHLELSFGIQKMGYSIYTLHLRDLAMTPVTSCT